jgi:indole-3-glycerol phosphate synthase
MILDEIVAHTRAEIAKHKRRTSEHDLRVKMASQPSVISLEKALRGDGVSLIAEIKRSSPSKGAFAPNLDAGDVASIYVQHGAAAISVLTDEQYFSGNLCDLEVAKRTVSASGHPVPILRKDFIVDPYQVLEARSSGADAVLLIVRILSDDELSALYEAVVGMGMTALVEVHDAADVERIKHLAPAVVGINHRNLSDFSTDLSVFARLREALPSETVVVAASGIRTAADVAAVGTQGADAVLVGEALVTATNIGAKVRELSGRTAT